jgi:hypothetical protein
MEEKTVINVLLKKAVEAPTSLEALQFSQAALNAANAVHSIVRTEHEMIERSNPGE